MGVQGLWELLAPVGRRVSVETLAGRKLAIDASIWLVQFMKAMRDEQGEMIRNAHLIGFFRRICKLLFLRVKPVFVFDGGTPILKRRTVIARRRQRDRAHSRIRKTAEKLLLNHLKTRKLEELIQQIQNAKDEKSNKDAVFEVGEPSGSKRQRQTDVASSSNAASTSNSQSNATQESADALLAASLAAEEHPEKDIYDLRDDYHSDDSLDGEEMILPAMQGEIDPAILASLPPSMQLDLLVQMREQQMALNRQKFRKMKKAPASFSQLQIESYLKTVAFRREIEEIQKSASSRGVGGVQSTHIASDPGRGYIFSTSFTGNKETLQISEKATDEISERAQCSTSNSASIRSSIVSETFAPQHESIAVDKDADSSVQTYVDERGQTRVSRVRGLGVRLTRDLQWNLYLMKESEDQATGNESESAPTETITKETSTQEESAHTNAKEVGIGEGFEISFKVDEVTAEDEQDEFFQALVAQDDGSSANLNFTAHVNSNDDTLVCEWEDGEINVSNEGLQVHSENDHTMAGQVVESDEDSEVEWEDVETNGNSEILIDRTERNNSKATTDQLLETTRDTEFENENGHSSVNCNMDISVKDSSSLVKNYLREDEELQEAIRLSLESFHAEKNASNGSKEAISISDFIQGTNKPRESLLGKSSGRTRNDKVDQISCRNDNSFDRDQSTGNQSVHVNGGKHETVIRNFASNLNGNFDKFVDRSVDKLKEDMVVDGNDVLLCGGQGHNFQSPSKDYVATMQMQSSYSRETGEHDLLDKNKFSDKISSDLGFCVSQSEDTVKEAKMASDVVKRVASESKGNVLENQLEVLEQKEAVMEGSLTNDSESERNVAENKLEVSDQEEAVLGEGLSKGLEDDEQLLKRETELLAIKEEIAKKKEYYEKELKEVKEAVQSDLNDEIAYLRQEELELRAAQKQQERNADSVSSEMFTECQELLQMFGLPYIIAPMEAEAQCASMELAKLVDGVVTDDCDAFLFGAECVYKNIFDNRKYVETYLMKDIENELGLNREKLVRMALLLGSDYTEGISGIGIVNAIEVVNAFPEEDGLKTFKDWLDSPDLSILDKLNNSKGKGNKKKQSKLNKNDANASTTEEERVLESSEGVTEKEQLDERSSVVKEIFMDKHRAVSKNWHVPDCFPNEAVISAYMNPQVDKSTEPCSWGRPDLMCLRKLCWEKFGWAKEKADELLIPVLREFDRHETQLRLESFYSFNERFAKIRSRRIQKAVTGITGRRSSELMDLPPHLTSGNSTRRSRKKQEAAVPTTVSEEATDNALEVQQVNENDKDNGDLQKKQNTRKGVKAQSGGGRPRGRGSSEGRGRGRGRGRKFNETRESDNSLTDTETETGDGKDTEKTVSSSSPKEPQIRKSARKRRKVNYVEDEQGSDKQEEDDMCKDDPPFEAAKVTDPPRSQDYVTVGGGFCDEDAEQPESKDSLTGGGGFCNTDADQPQAKDYLTAGGGFCNADGENDTLAVQDESLFTASDDIPNVTVISETDDRHPLVSKQKQDFLTVDESPGSSQANCKDKQTPGNPAAGSLKAVPFFRRKTRKHTGE